MRVSIQLSMLRSSTWINFQRERRWMHHSISCQTGWRSRLILPWRNSALQVLLCSMCRWPQPCQNWFQHSLPMATHPSTERFVPTLTKSAQESGRDGNCVLTLLSPRSIVSISLLYTHLTFQIQQRTSLMTRCPTEIHSGPKWTTSTNSWAVWSSVLRGGCSYVMGLLFFKETPLLARDTKKKTPTLSGSKWLLRFIGV